MTKLLSITSGNSYYAPHQIVSTSDGKDSGITNVPRRRIYRSYL